MEQQTGSCIKKIRILDKEFQISCPVENQEGLEQAALFLNQQMLEIRNKGKVIGLEKIAVMAALNIANELLIQKDYECNYIDSISSRLSLLQDRIDTALSEQNLSKVADLTQFWCFLKLRFLGLYY